jgi:hypothetical protein
LGLGRERGGSATAEPCAMQPVDAYDTNIISSRDIYIYDKNKELSCQEIIHCTNMFILMYI